IRFSFEEPNIEVIPRSILLVAEVKKSPTLSSNSMSEVCPQKTRYLSDASADNALQFQQSIDRQTVRPSA
ncbi:MAG: hypothetical protein ABGZ53_26860, partial [Fuerstiella sp.]